MPSAKDNVHVVIYTKSKNNCEMFFIYKKPDTLRYAIFHDLFCRWHLYTKYLTLSITFLYAKKHALCVTLLYLKFIEVLIPDYKHTYNQSNQIEKYIQAHYQELATFLQ